MAVIGGVLLVVGIVGLAAMFVLGNTAIMNSPPYTDGGSSGSTASLGQRIFNTGVGTDGAIPRTGGIGHMGSRGCVACHGQDGQGGQIGMMDFIEAPPITYDALTSAHDGYDDESEAGWTDAQIAKAIRTGREPNGQQLDTIMPRWDMNGQEMNALIDHLKTL